MRPSVAADAEFRVGGSGFGESTISAEAFTVIDSTRFGVAIDSDVTLIPSIGSGASDFAAATVSGSEISELPSGRSAGLVADASVFAFPSILFGDVADGEVEETRTCSQLNQSGSARSGGSSHALRGRNRTPVTAHNQTKCRPAADARRIRTIATLASRNRITPLANISNNNRDRVSLDIRLVSLFSGFLDKLL